MIFIALFRGINVGGNNLLPMKDLKTILEKLGAGNFKTYIQSGNSVFFSKEINVSRLSPMQYVPRSENAAGSACPRPDGTGGP